MVDLACIDQLFALAPAEIDAISFFAVEREPGDGQRLTLGAGLFHPIVDTTRDVPAVADLREFLWPRDLHTALQRKACDLVMPDFMRIGGVTGWLRASAIAGAAGIPMSTHLYPEVAAHVMRVTETAHWLEWQDWADPFLQRPYEIRDGCFTFLTRLALALNGMRKRSQPIKSTCRLISCSKDRLRPFARSYSRRPFAQGVEAGTWKFSTSINDKIRTVRRKSWQDVTKAVERLIEQALSPKSAARTSSFEVRSGFIPAESGKGGGLRLREDQDTIDNRPPSVDESN